MRLYVGNLPFAVTDDELRRMFEPYGEVVSASIVRDKFTEQPKGFAFVEMSSPEQGQAAVSALNGSMINNRTIEVAEARPMRDRGPGGGGGGGGFRRGGGGGGGGGGRGGRGGGGGGGGGNRW
jgi:cold-inducible RNA-binding protein